jgi:hypothetical protein
MIVKSPHMLFTNHRLNNGPTVSSNHFPTSTETEMFPSVPAAIHRIYSHYFLHSKTNVSQKNMFSTPTEIHRFNTKFTQPKIHCRSSPQQMLEICHWFVTYRNTEFFCLKVNISHVWVFIKTVCLLKGIYCSTWNGNGIMTVSTAKCSLPWKL